MEKPMRPFPLAALIVLLSAPAYSQAPGENGGPPRVNLSGLGQKTRSPVDEQRDQEVDQAYKSTTKKIPARNANADPWHDMRGTSASRNSQTKP
jgi:hypothetical protein